MASVLKNTAKFYLTGIFFCFSAFVLPAQTSPSIKLAVDATDAPRGILRAHMVISTSPGPLTLYYPKWIPGEHGPTGPITDLTGLRAMTTTGKPIAWQRDGVDMFAFHLDIPPGESAVKVDLDFLLPPAEGSFSSGASATPKLLDLNWNQVLLYPKTDEAHGPRFQVTLQLPEGWQFGTALPLLGGGAQILFKAVPLETLVDSPLIAGEFFRRIDLSPGQNPDHELDLVADSAAALEMKPEDRRHFEHLVSETGALFGARHYSQYHFLLTLSENVAHFGLEHHESSDNREGEKYLTDADELSRGAYLLSHEMVHSWNGKYRRPGGLATADFQQPMQGELLWVYEGLTDYLGIVLATRCGLWTNENFREYLALEAAGLDRAPGRGWRSLADTAVAAQLLYQSRSESSSWRRSTDFYSEGDLIWLEADVRIRQLTHGTKSLDDFCRTFHGGQSSPAAVKPYEKQDVFNALNSVASNDWAGFFQKRVYDLQSHAPLDGITESGWRLEFTNKVPEMQKAREGARKNTDLRLSLGLLVREDGYLIDVLQGSPAEKAGIGVAMKLVAVNDRAWNPTLLRAAIDFAATNSAPLRLLVQNEDFFKNATVNYHDGEKYACLVRDPDRPDLLGKILQPLTPEPAP